MSLHQKRLKRQTFALALALAAGVLVGFPGAAEAEGFFDFLFGGFQPRPAAPPPSNAYAEPGAVTPMAPRGSETVHRSGSDTGRVVAYCVRLCDGESFPLAHIANATPVAACRAMCPASKTNVFYGSSIDDAVARDGARYADLDNAGVYRKHLVANCTCNGRSAAGLAPVDLNDDPTLRPGDIVATKNGFVAYTGKRGHANAFTPVEAATLSAALNQETGPARAPVRITRRAEPRGPLYDEVPPPDPGRHAAR